jgi:hypothetical protein
MKADDIRYKAFAELWSSRAHRTVPIEPAVIGPAIEELYRRAGFGKPRVIVVPSPGALAYAGTFAARIWARRAAEPNYDPTGTLSGTLPIPANCKAIALATLAAVHTATRGSASQASSGKSQSLQDSILAMTYGPADVATATTLNRQTWMGLRDLTEQIEALAYWSECIRDAMRDEFGNPKPTELMARAAQDWALPLASLLFGDEAKARAVVNDAADWWRHAQSGNNWLHDTACIAAARDLHGLQLPEHESFAVWEHSQVNGGYRYLHPEFCLVSDFPEMIDTSVVRHSTQVRSRSLDQRITAPVIRWRDGWLV